MFFTTLLIAIVFFAYIILIIALIIGVYKVKYFDKKTLNNKSEKSKDLKFSIVIPFRNEEGNLEQLISNLANQDYPKKNYQIILVDDFSTDNSFEIAKKNAENYSSLSIKLFKNKIAGKKQALRLGISNSDYDFIITTDADCSHNKKWLSEIADFQHITNCNMIVAPVQISKSNNLFGKFQEIEFLSLQASTIGSIGINKPIMCNGANLIFQKKLFIKSNIKEEIASGDDMFLLHEIKRHPEYKINYLMSQNAIVNTNATENINAFINQRIRWASKAKYYKDNFSILTALIVFATTLSQIILLILSVFNVFYLYCFLIILIVKSIIDYALIYNVNSLFKIKNIFGLIIPFEIIYFIYTIYVGVLSIFSSSFLWKDRKYKY
ncbi:MAG: hypothetical protein A2033_09410 [Bacteroidetes bacterium GWA2_31_9]|nr:MAG: hypothetical protein A2033_09410 [Bacteroidetes bacterium GWA2_31_9]